MPRLPRQSFRPSSSPATKRRILANASTASPSATSGSCRFRFSTDGTVDVAHGKGARVEIHEWRGFGAQKNYALSLATGDWVLSIDADERATPELAAAIKAAIADTGADGCELPRISSFCGRDCGTPAGLPIMCCGCSAAARQASTTPWSTSG